MSVEPGLPLEAVVLTTVSGLLPPLLLSSWDGRSGVALGQGAQASGHEIHFDSLSNLGPPQPQAVLSSLEN